jgi:perosamine synthetase
MYSVLVAEPFSHPREELAAHLRSRGIDSRTFFHPLHILPPYQNGGSFPVSERLSRQGLNLPSGANLTECDLERVARAILELR